MILIGGLRNPGKLSLFNKIGGHEIYILFLVDPQFEGTKKPNGKGSDGRKRSTKQ